MDKQNRNQPPQCGQCTYCIIDGAEAFCAIQELYTFIETDGSACRDFVPKTKKQ